MAPSDAQLEYYTRHSPLSDPGDQSRLFTGLPSGIDALCRVVQGSLLHIFWAERYGVTLNEKAKEAVGLRPVSAKLARLAQDDPIPLAAARPLERRQAGNCRDFSLLLASLLRHQGVPARPRCGFGTYFMPDHFEDHWVCEYWNAGQERWVLVDAQLDELQRRVLEIDFDPLDVPRDRFIVGGQAWQMCRRGQADPSCFGILDMSGWWFIWGDLLRDFLALNKVEILPWDWWESPYWSHRLEDPLPAGAQELVPYDDLAALTLSGDEGFPALRARYESDPGFKPPFLMPQPLTV